LSETNIPEIWETEEDKTLSIGQLKYKYLQIARQQFQGKVFTNKETGKLIKISKDGLMEWWRKFRYYTLRNVKMLPV